MEALLANTHEIKGKLREKVEGAKELGVLSKQLATIETHVPITFEEDKLKMKKFNIDEVKELFDELEFKTILQRVLSVSGVEKTITINEETTTIEADEELSSGQLDMFSVNVF